MYRDIGDDFEAANTAEAGDECGGMGEKERLCVECFAFSVRGRGGAGAIERERLSMAGTFLEHSSVVDRQMLSHSTVKKDVRCLDLIGLHLIPR